MEENDDHEYGKYEIITDRKIEIWCTDIRSFERYKKHAYEFIPVSFSRDTPFYRFGRVEFPIDMALEKDIAVTLNYKTDYDAYQQGVEAIVEADFSGGTIVGLPVRRSKGKLGKLICEIFSLKYVYDE